MLVVSQYHIFESYKTNIYREGCLYATLVCHIQLCFMLKISGYNGTGANSINFQNKYHIYSNIIFLKTNMNSAKHFKTYGIFLDFTVEYEIHICKFI